MSTQNNKDAVIDQARLESITGSDKAVISDLMKLFVESTQKLLNDIQKDIQLHDSLAGKNHCHQLKGSCGNVGANQMYEIAIELEQVTIKNDWKQAEQLFQTEKKALETVKKFLDITS